MSIVRELLDDAIALQKDGLSPGRIGLALTDRWEAEELGAAGKVKRTRSPSGAIELLFPGGEEIVWNGASWNYIPVGDRAARLAASLGTAWLCHRRPTRGGDRWPRTRRRHRRKLQRLLGRPSCSQYSPALGRWRCRVPRRDRDHDPGPAPPALPVSRDRVGRGSPCCGPDGGAVALSGGL